MIIVERPPKLAVIRKIKISTDTLKGYDDFKIIESEERDEDVFFLSPDIAPCEKCMEEVLDAKSSRYLYPFTNCTDCGPRYSIIERLPYDRKGTTMSSFSMCPDCEGEYKDPESRRFHAQPNCCKKCGPQYTFIDLSSDVLDDKIPIKLAKEKINQGEIVAIKGLGGFHLCCDASNERVLALLRERKRRPHKPLAVMVKDIQNAKKITKISNMEKELLEGKNRPILLLERREDCSLPEGIASEVSTIGVMLPYTPMHHLLFDDKLSYLVMTSGNIGGQPLQYKNEQGVKALSEITNYFLIHNRDIHVPVDDSVVKVVLEKEMVSRPGRGYSPFSFPLSKQQDKEILAVGAQQKSTFCLLKKGYATMSQYLGDLNDFNNYKRYEKTINHILEIYGGKPEIVIHDFHPQYSSTQYAKTRLGKHIGVQHHHAHMVSCMVEHKLFNKVIGVIFDGTGFGTDDAIWGGEFLVGDRKGYERAAHLQYVLLQGGDMVIKEPWRSGAAYLHAVEINPEKYLKNIDRKNISTLRKALVKEFNCFRSSSMGRFFDCISSLIGLCNYTTYDGQGAIALENIINKAVKESYPYHIMECNNDWIISYKEIIKHVIKDLDDRIGADEIAAKFHNTIIDLTIDMVCIIQKKAEIRDIVLSGGVFENRYLLNGIYGRLKNLDLSVYFNQRIPINDNGISIGQVGIGDEMYGGK